MTKRKTVAVIIVSILLALCVAVGAVVAATVTKTRYTDFTFTFGQLTATPSVTQDSQSVTFNKSGDSKTFTVNVDNAAGGNAATYSFSLDAGLSDVSGAQFLVFIDGSFVGTLASVQSQSSVYEGIALAGESLSHSLAVEYHNTGAPSQVGNISLTVSCTARSLDTRTHTLIPSEDDLLYTLRAIVGGYITTPRTLILTGDVALSFAAEYDLKKVVLKIDTFGHSLSFGGSTLVNADVEIYSSRAATSEGGTETAPAISALVVGAGSFVNFADSVSVSEVTLSDGYNSDAAIAAIKSYLSADFDGRKVEAGNDTGVEKGDKYLGSLAVYADNITCTVSGNTVKITCGGATYTAYTVDTVATFTGILEGIMTAQRASSSDKGETDKGWDYTVDHTDYDFYLPVTLASGTDSAAVVWDSSLPSVVGYDGEYVPANRATTVQLTAAVSAYGHTEYVTYYVRTAGLSFAERMKNMCSQIQSPTLAKTSAHTLVSADSINSFISEYAVTDFTGSGGGTSVGVATDEYGNITVTALNGNSEEEIVTLTASFSEDGKSGTETFNIPVYIDVAAINPEKVLDMVQEEAAKINVLENILNDHYHELHESCGQGSFTLPATYPLGSVVGANPSLGQTEAQYLIGYAVEGDGYNNAAVSIAKNGEINGNIFNIDPEKLLPVQSQLHIRIYLYGTDGTSQTISDNIANKQYFTIDLPAAFTVGNNAGFVSNATDSNGVDYVFAQVRDQVEAVQAAKLQSCENHSVEERKFILLYSINLANRNGLTALDLSAPDGVEGYKVSSIYCLTQFTNLTSLYLANTHIGDESAYQVDGTAVKNMDIIAGRTTLATLNLENCDITTIVSFKALTNLTDVNLAGNTILRNISALLLSSKTLATLDICDTYAALYDIESGTQTIENNEITWHYHSVLEELYDDYVAANSAEPTYYISGHGTAIHTVYNPYVFGNSSDDIVREIAKNYAYRFENIIEMTNVIHLQNTVIVAGGEPYASINWKIVDITDADGNKLTEGTHYTTSTSDFSKPLVLDLTPGKFRLTRGYTVDSATGAIEYNGDATGWVVNLEMTITVAGRSYSRNFYISVLDKFSTTDTDGQS